jgi:predicted acylesterase/phospholipase RssA
MEEAERFCDKIAIIDVGSIIAQGTLKELRKVSDVKDLITSWGMLDYSKVKQYFAKMVVNKWGGIPTFEELYRNGIVYVCTAYKLGAKDPCVYFSHRTHGTMSAVDAAMLSCTIPFLFKSAKYQDHYYIDGGVFDSNPAYYLEQMMLEERKDQEHTNKILSVSVQMQHEDEEINTLMDYIKEVVFVPMYAQEKIVDTEHINHIQIHSDNGIELVMQPTNTKKIQWFCEGLQKGLTYFEEKNKVKHGTSE